VCAGKVQRFVVVDDSRREKRVSWREQGVFNP